MWYMGLAYRTDKTDTENKETADSGSTDTAVEKESGTEAVQTGDDLNLLPLTAAILAALAVSLAAAFVIRKRRYIWQKGRDNPREFRCF